MRRTTGRGLLPSGAPIGLAVALLSGALPCAAGEGAAVHLLAESTEQVLFEVRVPRPDLSPVTVGSRTYTAVSLAGAAHPQIAGVPDLPLVEYLVALPPGAEAIATVVSAEAQTLASGRPLPVPERNILPSGGGRPAADEGLPRLRTAFEPDPLIYESLGRHPAELVHASRALTWRHHRIAPIVVHPVQYDPASGELLWFSRLVVRVQFAGGAEGLEEGRAFPQDQGRWETLFRRTLLNHRSARGFRRAPRTLPQRMRMPLQEASEFRITVPATGLYQLPFADLVAAGLEAEDLAWEELRLVVRDYDDEAEPPEQQWEISFLAVDPDQDGRFAEGEALIFYGLDSWDFFDLERGDRRYGRANTYWLLIGAGAGAPMAEEVSWFGWEGLTPPSSFERTVHFEENLWYMPSAARGPNGDTRSPTPGPFAVHSDHYNWTYYGAMEGTETVQIKVVPFDLPAMLTPAVEFCVRLQGQYQSDYGHQPRLWLSRSDSDDLDEVWDSDWAFPGNPYQISNLYDLTFCVEGGAIPSTVLRKGRNYIKIYLPRSADAYDGIDADGVGIDWFEVSYNGLFEMTSGELLAVLAGLSGQQELVVKKIAGSAETPPVNDLLIFDLTDPHAPVRLIAEESQFEYSASSRRWELRLQLDCGSGTPTKTVWVIERDELGSLPEGSIEPRTGTPLTEFAGEDLIAIYAERFATAIEPLLSHREGQGHAVLRVPVTDAYDTYSGGRPNPFAIKRLLRRMWRESDPPPEYLLLVGDASNDIAGYALGVAFEAADTNWVPSPTIVGPWNELIPCDQWYVDNLGGSWGADMNYLPDMHVGRISCGSPQECTLYVDKVLAYEQESPTADWRSRILMVTDDTFSSREIGTGYEYQSSEVSFLTITRSGVRSILADSIFTYFRIDSLYLPTAMDTVVELGRCIPDSADEARCLCHDTPWPWPRSICYHSGEINYLINKQFGEGSGDYEGAGVREVLLEMLARGALVWAFQGHSNRSLLTHEYIFRHSDLAGRTDVFDLSNTGRPFLFMGYGCHLADYASHWEADSRRGDAMQETMLFCCEEQPRGAIGALSSVDYEWIGHDYQAKVFDAMFDDPPRDPQAPPGEGSRWRMGEVMTHSKLKVIEEDRSERITYMLLGDPALRLGIAPPTVQLSLNGVAWDQGENGEYVSDRDDDSLTLIIRILDDSQVTLEQISDFGGTVPPDSLEILDTDEDDRSLLLRHRTQVQRRPYEIRVAARDYDGSRRQITVQVPMSVTLYEEVDEELIPLSDGYALGDTASITATVRCAAHLQGEDVLLMAGETELEPIEVGLSQDPGEPFLWTFRFGDLRGVPPGELTLAIHVAQYDGGSEILASADVEVGRVTLRFAEQPFWMPNPFAQQSYLVYNLTAPSTRTRLRIFTASGRRIFEDETLPTRQSVRHYLWEGRDDDGDRVANGLYFYELAIWDEQGQLADRVIDKVVRVD